MRMIRSLNKAVAAFAVVAVAAAAAASGAIVSGSTLRGCDSEAEGSSSAVMVHVSGFSTSSLTASESSPFECREFSFFDSNAIATLDCTPAPYLLILVK